MGTCHASPWPCFSGSLVLGAAGLLDGLTATTHWACYDETAARAMQLMIEYDPEPPYDAGSPERASAEVRQRVDEYAALRD